MSNNSTPGAILFATAIALHSTGHWVGGLVASVLGVFFWAGAL
jgi:hypothetical protein